MRKGIFAMALLLTFSAPLMLNAQNSAGEKTEEPASQEPAFVPPDKKKEAVRKAEEEKIKNLRKSMSEREAAVKEAQKAREMAARARATGVPSTEPEESKESAPR